MITNITLENFKCFRQVSINPKRLTVLIGPNGTGKSSILQALLLHKQTVGMGMNRPIYQGEFVDLRGPNEVAPNFIEESTLFSVRIEVSNSQEVGAISQVYEKLRLVPALRGLLRPRYALGDEYVEYITSLNGFDAQEGQLATNLVYGSSSTQKLSEMLEKVTKTGLEAKPVPRKAVEVKSVTSRGSVNITAEGFGTNSLVQLFHQLIIAEEGATVLIEEPEIHLHPKAQADLAEVMSDTAKAEDKQIIMTTHSEHLVERLLLLVAEGEALSPDELAIYSFAKDDKGECSLPPKSW